MTSRTNLSKSGFEFIYFKAADNKILANSYYNSHKNILDNLGLGFLPSSKDWMDKEDVYCFGLLDPIEKDHLIAGLRIQIRTAELLPLEKSLESESEKIVDFVKHLYTNGKVAEMCGLWVDPKYSKLGLPYDLSKYAMDIVDTLPITDLLIFYSNYTKELVEILGFKHVNKLEHQGKFPYPTEEYMSYVGHKILV